MGYVNIEKAKNLKKITKFIGKDGKEYKNAEEYYSGHNVGGAGGANKTLEGKRFTN